MYVISIQQSVASKEEQASCLSNPHNRDDCVTFGLRVKFCCLHPSFFPSSLLSFAISHFTFSPAQALALKIDENRLWR